MRKTANSSAGSQCSGFTLVELMISIAIVLLLVAGINLIFQTTSKAVGSGLALSEGARNNQAAQAVMYHDFASCVTDDAPYIIISNEATPAFRTLADQQGDRDYDATAAPAARRNAMLTVDLDNDNKEGISPGETISPATYNDRNHRIDMISFFARDVFKRQTGNPGTYVPDETANEAMVWYGHMYIPNNSGGFSAGDTLPGGGVLTGNDNPNNFFASQWILGRQVMMLNGNPGVAPVDKAGTAQNFFQTDTVNVNLSPLQYNPALPAQLKLYTADDTAGFAAIQYSRYDICDTNMALFKKRITALLDVAPATLWWTELMGGANVNRFACNPFVSKPITSADFAKTAPIFLPACSQFIVEFAGDFVTQDAAGNVAAPPATPDNTLDYVVDATTGAHKVRWYGMPRNVYTGDDSPGGEKIVGNSTATSEVVPVYAIAGAQQTFERNVNPNPLVPPAPPDFATATPANGEYVCAWGPSDTNRPQLIRVTYSLDDPASRLGNPLTYEYVFKIK